MCAFLCLAGYTLSQMLIISILHVAQFVEIARASKDNRHAEFRRPLEDYILPVRKDHVERILNARRDLIDASLAEQEAREADWKVRKDRFVSIMKNASQTHLIVDTLIATVAFTVGITMPGGFIGQEGPHSGSDRKSVV